MLKFIITIISFRRWFQKEFAVLSFTLFYLIFFTIYAIIQKNTEFIFYSSILFFVLYLGIIIHKRVQLPEFIIIGFSLFGLLHLLGGNLVLNGTRLYETTFFYNTIRYDNIVHFIGSGLATLAFNVLLYDFFQTEKKVHHTTYYLVLIFMTLGVGTLNEIIEFFAVIFFHAQEEVGDYINNSVDLIYNFIGALAMILLIDFSYSRKK